MDLDRTPLTGTIAGRYEIRREAGRGGMAVVYLAWDLRHDRPVALKVLRPEIGLLLGADRFLREIQIAAHLAHPHILGVIDSGLLEVEGGGSLPYYVMPFMEGQSLAERLAREPQLPADEALRIAAEVADALQYAHGSGVIHRDIKPANILLQEGHALVADFGIARMLAERSSTGTTAGVAIGTPNYMSPEQFLADLPVDGRSDVYSLGCVLYEMLSGEPPFTGSTPQAISARHQLERPRDLRVVRPDLPPAIQQAVGRALAKVPADRYTSATEFRDTLNRLRATSEAFGTAQTTRRVPWLAAATAVVAILVAMAVWQFRPTGGGGEAAAPTRIVVAYFQDLTGGGLQAVADEITESLTDRLQAIPDLAVTASAMVAPYRGAPPDSLRARFPADRLVTGTVGRSGDSTTVTARIVDPTSGRLLATKTFKAAPAPAVAGLVENLSAFIRETLWQHIQQAARRRQVTNDSTWQLVERARVLREEAEDAVVVRADREGFKALDRADSLLLAARRRDGKSVLVPLEIARTAERRAFLAEYIQQLDLVRNRNDLPDPAAAQTAALGVLDQVLREHPQDPEAHEFRGEIWLGLYRVTGTDSLLRAAIADLEQAKTLAPGRARSWSELSQAYQLAGRYPESQLAIEQGTKVDVFQVNRKDLLRGRFETALLLAEYPTADSACRAALSQWPDDQRFSDCELELWGRSRSDRGSGARALAMTDSLARIERNGLLTALRTLWAGAILARAGLGDSADRVAAQVLRTLAPSDMGSSLLIEVANLRLTRGDRDSALALIAVAVRINRLLVPYLRNAPWFKDGRTDPRFDAALAGISPREAAGRP